MLFGRKNTNYSQVSVNGRTIRVSGGNITIKDNAIYVDGKLYEDELSGSITIIVEGNCHNLEVHNGSVEVHGNCGAVDCGGSVRVGGDVGGDVDAGGSVQCENILGNVDAGGSIQCKGVGRR